MVKDLIEGDLLRSHDGRWIYVAGLNRSGITSDVYNLRVAEHHTYFVGARDWGFSVWAHNTCYQEDNGSGQSDSEQYRLDNDVDPHSNVAIYYTKDGDGTIQSWPFVSQGGGFHAEPQGGSLTDSNVIGMYTDLSPCDGTNPRYPNTNCKEWLDGNFPDLTVTYTWKHPDEYWQMVQYYQSIQEQMSEGDW